MIANRALIADAAAEPRGFVQGTATDSGWVTPAVLHRAIDRNELFLEYQPKIEGRTRAPCGVEALVRRAHPLRGIVPPDEFLPLAEREGLMDRLSAFVFDTALEQAAAWRRGGFACPVSVNLSARSLHDLELPDRLGAACTRLGVPASEVTLELTETAAMDDGARAIDILTRFRLKGFLLAIDDFGTGYSSLAQLHRLPFCELKIDRTFTRDCDTRRESLVIVRAMIDLAHNLGLKACAEGVESEAIAGTLEALGCDSLQGFHFARPMRAARVPGFAGRIPGIDAPSADRFGLSAVL